MSEISITRFQPALAAREKVNSVEPIENDVDASESHNPLQRRSSDQHPSGKHPRRRAEDMLPAKKSAGDKQSESPVERSESEQDALETAVSRLNEYVQTVKRDLVFDIDPLSLEPSVTVVDRESRKVLRQFDSKEALEMARKLESEEPISLFRTQV